MRQTETKSEKGMAHRNLVNMYWLSSITLILYSAVGIRLFIGMFHLYSLD